MLIARLVDRDVSEKVFLLAFKIWRKIFTTDAKILKVGEEILIARREAFLVKK